MSSHYKTVVDVYLSASDLEFIFLNDATRLQVLADFMKDCQHGDVGLPSTSWSTDQKVLVGVVGCLKHYRLNPVQALHPLENQLPDLCK